MDLAVIEENNTLFSASEKKFSTRLTGEFDFKGTPFATLKLNGNLIYSNKWDLLFRQEKVKLIPKLLRLKSFKFILHGGNELTLTKSKLFSDNWVVRYRGKVIGTYSFKVTFFPWKSISKIETDSTDKNIQELLLFTLCFMFERDTDQT